jgi:hypothetical protein
MNQRRKFRPTVTGLEERLALNGTMAAAGVMAQAKTGIAAVADLKHKGGVIVVHHGGVIVHHGGVIVVHHGGVIVHHGGVIVHHHRHHLTIHLK